jgi:phosphoribosyl 1,2-cyclic phosphate phosphodiesterase
MELARAKGLAIESVIDTHAHADHIFGVDDLRRFNAIMQRALDIYADEHTLARFQEIFRYIFQPQHNVNDSFIPTLVPHRLEPGDRFDLCGARWTALGLLHGRLPILGFRIDYPSPDIASPADNLPGVRGIAYCTDCSAIPPETYPLLENLDVLVIDGLRYRHHPTHLTVDQALYEIEQIQPRRAYLTHIAHDISHVDLAAQLPPNVLLSHDGLTVSVP